MAGDNEGFLDGIPLLKATFDENVHSFNEKMQEGIVSDQSCLLLRPPP
jgi:hypothetical protein